MAISGFRVAGNLACRRPFRPPSQVWAFVPTIRCSRRGADARVCSADTHGGAAFVERRRLAICALIKRRAEARPTKTHRCSGGARAQLDLRRIFPRFVS